MKWIKNPKDIKSVEDWANYQIYRWYYILDNKKLMDSLAEN